MSQRWQARSFCFFFQMFEGFPGSFFSFCQLACLSKGRITLGLIIEQETLSWRHFDTQVFSHSSLGQAATTEAVFFQSLS